MPGPKRRKHPTKYPIPKSRRKDVVRFEDNSSYALPRKLRRGYHRVTYDLAKQRAKRLTRANYPRVTPANPLGGYFTYGPEKAWGYPRSDLPFKMRPREPGEPWYQQPPPKYYNRKRRRRFG